MPQNFVALRYMDGFSCIGGACEDNCCGQWDITVDQSTHQRLKKVMSKDPEQAALFDKTFVLLPLGKRERERFSSIPEAAASRCPMLTPDKLCQIHAHHGETLLPSICATYPRRHVVVDGRGELSGEISCPEVARRALLPEGGSDVVEVTEAVYGSPRLVRTFVSGKAKPFAAPLDEVRGTLYQIFSLGEYPLASRLYIAMSLAERLNGFFHQEAKTVDDARLMEQIRSVEAPEVRDALHESFRALPGDGPLATSLIAQALAARLIYDRVARMLRLVEATFKEYSLTGQGAHGDGEGGWRLSPEPLWNDFRARWDRLQSLHGERIERWLTNYCLHYVMYDWYFDAPTLLAFLQALVLKLAMTRFMLAGHPLVKETEGKSPEESLAILERAVVEVVYTLARSFEHSPAFIAALARTLSEKMGASSTVALLKL
jgi:lysine-N-methylase